MEREHPRVNDAGEREDARHDIQTHMRAPAENDEAHHDRGPDEIELFLGRERPVMLYRARMRVLGEVILGAREEEPVRVVETRGNESPAVFGDCRGCRERLIGRGRCEQDKECRGKQAPHAAGVERDEPQPASVEQLPHEQRRDEEARKDEEDVDARVAVIEERDACMEENDEKRCDRPYTVKRRTVAEPALATRR